METIYTDSNSVVFALLRAGPSRHESSPGRQGPNRKEAGDLWIYAALLMLI